MRHFPFIQITFSSVVCLLALSTTINGQQTVSTFGFSSGVDASAPAAGKNQLGAAKISPPFKADGPAAVAVLENVRLSSSARSLADASKSNLLGVGQVIKVIWIRSWCWCLIGDQNRSRSWRAEEPRRDKQFVNRLIGPATFCRRRRIILTIRVFVLSCATWKRKVKQFTCWSEGQANRWIFGRLSW